MTAQSTIEHIRDLKIRLRQASIGDRVVEWLFGKPAPLVREVSLFCGVHPAEDKPVTYSTWLCERFAREAMEAEAERANEPPFPLWLIIERNSNVERLARAVAVKRRGLKLVGAV